MSLNSILKNIGCCFLQNIIKAILDTITNNIVGDGKHIFLLDTKQNNNKWKKSFVFNLDYIFQSNLGDIWFTTSNMFKNIILPYLVQLKKLLKNLYNMVF